MKEILNKIANEDVKTYIKKVHDNSIACIFTDVPYEISNSGSATNPNAFGWCKTGAKKNKKIFDHNDIKPSEYLPDFYRVLEDTGHIYLMTNSTHLASVQIEMEKAGFIINNILVMIKDNCVTNQHYMKNCELTIFARKGGSKGLRDFGIKSAVNVKMPRGEHKIHDTEKPLDYVKRLIFNSTKEGDIVADFFAGSGNVANACIDLKLDFIGCEIDKKFHDKILDRIERAKGNVGLFQF